MMSRGVLRRCCLRCLESKWHTLYGQGEACLSTPPSPPSHLICSQIPPAFLLLGSAACTSHPVSAPLLMEPHACLPHFPISLGCLFASMATSNNQLANAWGGLFQAPCSNPPVLSLVLLCSVPGPSCAAPSFQNPPTQPLPKTMCEGLHFQPGFCFQKCG